MSNSSIEWMPVQKAVTEALGHTPSNSTCTSWILRGVSGIKLSARRVGARLLSTPQKVTEFQAAVDAVRGGVK